MVHYGDWGTLTDEVKGGLPKNWNVANLQGRRGNTRWVKKDRVMDRVGKVPGTIERGEFPRRQFGKGSVAQKWRGTRKNKRGKELKGLMRKEHLGKKRK